MRYFISNNIKNTLFKSNLYEIISEEEAIELLMKEPILGLDTETTGFDPHTKELLSVQIGTFDFQICIDVKNCNFNKFKVLFEDNTKLFLLQNAKFDLKFFYKKQIVIQNIFDTYLAERLLYLGYPFNHRGFSLKALGNNYLNIDIDKSVRGAIFYEGLSDRVIVYGCDDVKYLIPIYKKQLDALEEKDLLKAISLENEFVKVLAYIEFCGIKLDKDKWNNRLQKNLSLLKQSENDLNDWVLNHLPDSQFIDRNLQGDLFSGFDTSKYCNINWDSPLQVIELFKLLGFNLLVKDKKTGKYKYSVEANVIESQASISSITPFYLKYKGYAKDVSTYGYNFIESINPTTNRIHTQFNQLVDTGRLSSGGKNKDTGEKYINFQNIPADEETRECFIASEGYILCDCDYTAQEDLVFTELSQEPKLIDFYNDKISKRDGHSFVAKICYPDILKDIEEIKVKKEFPKLRANAKKAKFAIHYGGNAYTISKNLNISKEEGERIEKAYLKGFTGINQYFQKVKDNMWKRGYILISELTGHKRFLSSYEELLKIRNNKNSAFWEEYKRLKNKNPNDENIIKIKEGFKKIADYERDALNTPVQGTAALITKVAAIKYFNHLLEKNLLFKVLIINIVHDEILLEIPIQIAEKEAKNLQKAMEDAGKIFVKIVTLKAEPLLSNHWIH